MSRYVAWKQSTITEIILNVVLTFIHAALRDIPSVRKKVKRKKSDRRAFRYGAAAAAGPAV